MSNAFVLEYTYRVGTVHGVAIVVIVASRLRIRRTHWFWNQFLSMSYGPWVYNRVRERGCESTANRSKALVLEPTYWVSIVPRVVTVLMKVVVRELLHSLVQFMRILLQSSTWTPSLRMSSSGSRTIPISIRSYPSPIKSCSLTWRLVPIQPIPWRQSKLHYLDGGYRLITYNGAYLDLNPQTQTQVQHSQVRHSLIVVLIVVLIIR